MKKIINITVLTLLVSSFLTGCAVYRPEVQQGNALDKETVAQLQRGMSKAEVAALLGTPLLQDNFRSDRWDYVFFNGTGGGQQKNKQNLVLLFKNDQLVQVKK